VLRELTAGCCCKWPALWEVNVVTQWVYHKLTGHILCAAEGFTFFQGPIEQTYFLEICLGCMWAMLLADKCCGQLQGLRLGALLCSIYALYL